MTALEIRREDVAGAVTLKLSGTIDNRTALELRRSLDALEQIDPRDLVLDFSGVHAFSDAAAAVLTRGMKRAVTLRGLDQHRERLFAYLGVAPRSAPRSGAYVPEEVLLAR